MNIPAEEIGMKFRKLFILSIPFSLIGLKKIAEHFHGHEHGYGHGHHGYHGRRCGRGHMLKFMAWRLGLSPDQKTKLEELYATLKTDLKPFSEKRDEVHRILTTEFRKEQFSTDGLKEQCTPEMLAEAREAFMKGIGGLHDLLTPVQRDKLASMIERRNCHH